jgi:PTS system mannose-specific IID component
MRGARLFARSLLLQAGFSDERRQGLGFAWAIDPALVEAYRGREDDLRDARLRQLSSFNTQPNAVGLVLGASAELEARAAAGDAAALRRAPALKAALGAALAGAADALFWGALRPLAAAVAVLAAFAVRLCGGRSPLLVGAAAGLAVFNVPALAARGLGLERGLRGADGAAAAAAALPIQRWIAAARLAAAAAIFLAAAAALGLHLAGASPTLAAASFAFGAGLSRPSYGPLRLVAAAGLVGAAASAATGWIP